MQKTFTFVEKEPATKGAHQSAPNCTGVVCKTRCGLRRLSMTRHPGGKVVPDSTKLQRLRYCWTAGASVLPRLVGCGVRACTR